MSPEQSEWLQKNRRFRATHQVGGNTRFAQRRMLHPDGTVDVINRGQNPRVMVGSFEVGVLEIRDPNTGQWHATT